MTLNSITAVILRYSTKLGSFGGQLHKSDSRQTDTICDKKCSQKNLVFRNV